MLYVRSSMSTKSGTRARLGNRLGGRDERVRHRDDRCRPASTPAAIKSKSQRIGPAADADAIARLTELGEVVFKSLHHRAADKARGFKRLREMRHKLFFELLMRSYQIQKRDLTSHAFTCSPPQIRRLYCARTGPDCPPRSLLAGTSSCDHAAGAHDRVLTDRHVWTESSRPNRSKRPS